jgi:hypothetical protein
MGLQYTPGATRFEVIQMFRLAARRRVPVFTHIRSAGQREPGSSVEAVGEVIAAAAVSGAPLQIVHINSSGLRDAPQCLALVEGARARGLDVTTEAYPYEAGMTLVNSALFNPGWREKLGIDYGDLQLAETGERLTKERFEAVHGDPTPRMVLVFANPAEVMDEVLRHPLVMIASDGIREHPRNAGTFARILGPYVRERRQLTLMDALRKMTLMPAERLRSATPAALRKGRLQEGADADLVVFDPETIADRATYASPTEPSVGVKYLLVGGTLVVEGGRVVSGVMPGQALVNERPESVDEDHLRMESRNDRQLLDPEVEATRHRDPHELSLLVEDAKPGWGTLFREAAKGHFSREVAAMAHRAAALGTDADRR